MDWTLCIVIGLPMLVTLAIAIKATVAASNCHEAITHLRYRCDMLCQEDERIGSWMADTRERLANTRTLAQALDADFDALRQGLQQHIANNHVQPVRIRIYSLIDIQQSDLRGTWYRELDAAAFHSEVGFVFVFSGRNFLLQDSIDALNKEHQVYLDRNNSTLVALDGRERSIQLEETV